MLLYGSYVSGMGLIGDIYFSIYFIWPGERSLIGGQVSSCGVTTNVKATYIGTPNID